MRLCAKLAGITLVLGAFSSGARPLDAPPSLDADAAALPGGWEPLAGLDDGAESWFFSRRDATRADAGVSVWRRIEFRDPRPGVERSPSWTGTYLSLIERVEVNCSNPSERLRAATAFHGRNLIDPIRPSLTLDSGQSAWEPALPGTRPARFIETVCAAFATHRMRPL